MVVKKKTAKKKPAKKTSTKPKKQANTQMYRKGDHTGRKK